MSRHKRRRPSPALVVSCIALFVALSGSAYALTKGEVKTQNIARGAVTSPKLDKQAVKGGKLQGGAVKGGKIQSGAVKEGKLAENAVTPAAIADGAVGTSEIAAEARGVALAGATVDENGTVTHWFNRFGGAPTIVTTGPGGAPGEGFHTVTFPGLGPFANRLIAQATLASGPGGEVAAQTDPQGNPQVITWISDGTLANRSFQILVYEATATG